MIFKESHFSVPRATDQKATGYIIVGPTLSKVSVLYSTVTLEQVEFQI